MNELTQRVIAAANIPQHDITDSDLERLVKFAVLACMVECQQVSYDAMELKLDYGSQQLEFERASKSGRKFGAIDCIRRISEQFDVPFK